MISIRPWWLGSITEADFDTKTQLTDVPKQFAIPRILITVYGGLDVLAGGTTDYITTPDTFQALIKNIMFRVGGANVIKDIPGYASSFMTRALFPNGLNLTAPAGGTTLGVGSSTFFYCNYSINFSDYNLPYPIRDQTILIPSRYQDTLLELEWANFEDVCITGDRPVTMSLTVNVSVIQDQNPVGASADVLREFTATTDVTATQDLEIKLPQTELISQINCYKLQDGMPFLDVDGTFTIEANSGRTIIYEGTGSSFGSIYAGDMGLLISTTEYAGPIPFNLDLNHDQVGILNNRALYDWTMRVPVIAPVAPATKQVLNHYIGRVPAG